MDNFLDEISGKKQEKAPASCGYRRLFVFVLAIAFLAQIIGLIQMQLSLYHQALKRDFKVILAVTGSVSNEDLTALGESLNAQNEVLSVKLFSPQDALQVLQAKNPRLTQALVALGREPMPAYFELRLADNAINTARSFTQNLAVQYPNLAVRSSSEQADMVRYSGLCLRCLNILTALTLVLFLIFMFMVEAYPVQEKKRNHGSAWIGLLAGMIAFGVIVLIVYPTGLLADNLAKFTSWGRQLIVIFFCGLLGWTLGKWQKF